MSEDNFPIKEISVHCTATDDHNDYGVADVTKWHQERGWNKCGYTYVVRRTGAIERGREDGEIPAAVYSHNRHMLAVCWVGTDHIEPAQYLTLVHLIACLCRKYGITERNVKGHREFPAVAKSCPNLDCNQLRADIAIRLAEKQVGADAGLSCELVGGACSCRMVKP